MQEELIKSAFGISPDTVFGFLVLLMLFIIIAMGVCIRYLVKRIESITSNFLEVIESNTKVIEELSQTIKEDNDPDKKKLKWMELTTYLDHKFDQLNRNISRR